VQLFWCPTAAPCTHEKTLKESRLAGDVQLAEHVCRLNQSRHRLPALQLRRAILLGALRRFSRPLLSLVGDEGEEWVDIGDVVEEAELVEHLE